MDPALADAVAGAKALAKFRFNFGNTSPYYLHLLGVEVSNLLSLTFPQNATQETLREMRDQLQREPPTDFSPGHLGEMERIALKAVDGYLAQNGIAKPVRGA